MEESNKKFCVHDEKCLITYWSHQMILHVYFFEWFSVRSKYERNDILFVSETHFITDRAWAWDIVINSIAVFLIQYHITWLSCVFEKNALLFFSPFILQIEWMISIKCNIFHTNWICTLYCNEWNNIWYFLAAIWICNKINYQIAYNCSGEGESLSLRD